MSVSAIKSSVRSRYTQGEYDSDGASSEEGAERLLRAKVDEAPPTRKHKLEEAEGECV